LLNSKIEIITSKEVHLNTRKSIKGIKERNQYKIIGKLIGKLIEKKKVKTKNCKIK